MRPEDLISGGDDELREEQQAAFDLQCFKELIRSMGLHVKWAEAVAGDEGATPWQNMEEETGIRLPYFIAGRRVKRFNLLNLVLGRRLSKDPLLEAFDDLREIADDRQIAMIFRFSGDQSKGIPGTKMVLTDARLEGLGGIWIAQRSPVLRVVPYADWRQELVSEHGSFGL